MATQTVTDNEFIELWRRNGSPTKLAKTLGVTVRNIYSRRRRIETRRGVSLETELNNFIGGGAKHEAGQRATQLALERARRYEHEMVDHVTDGVVLVASDAHYWPGLVTIAHQAFCKLAKDLKPVMVVLNGDILDGARISRHARIMWDKTPELKDEVHALQDRGAEIERAAKTARLVRTIGNHDARFENYLSANAPDFEEMTGSTLMDYLPRWRAGWLLHLNPEAEGWTAIRHRPVSGGIHAAHNSTLRAGIHYCHGHLHKLQVTPWGDYRGRRYGVDTGSLAEPKGPQFNYTEAAPSTWASGFAVLTYHRGRLLPPETCVVDGDAAWFRGQKIVP